MEQGFDCSHNDNINWAALSTDFKFMFIKAAQGISFHDPAFQDTWHTARAKGMIVGCYDFWNAQADPAAQADNFLNRGVDWSLEGILPPVIDLENQVGATPAISQQLDQYILNNKDKCRDNALELLDLVAHRTGRTPIVYCSPNFLNEYLGDSKPFANNGLWIAGYQARLPKLPDGFTDWLFWQYSEFGTQHGNPTGGNLDLNVFNGDYTALQKLANFK